MLLFALSCHDPGGRSVGSWSTIMPVESAEVARHPYRCRITWMALDMRGLMAARPHARSISILWAAEMHSNGQSVRSLAAEPKTSQL